MTINTAQAIRSHLLGAVADAGNALTPVWDEADNMAQAITQAWHEGGINAAYDCAQMGTRPELCAAMGHRTALDVLSEAGMLPTN